MSSRGLLVLFLSISLLGLGCDKDKDGGGGGGTGDPAKVAALEKRISTLEADAKKYAPMLEQIKKQFDRQAAQQQDEEDSAPAEDAVFAVDVKGNEIEGPQTALVTIVEAWDFG